MTSRVEITKSYPTAYRQAGKRQKSQILDTLTELTGWNRDYSRQQLSAGLKQPKGRAAATVAVIGERKTKASGLRISRGCWGVTCGE